MRLLLLGLAGGVSVSFESDERLLLFDGTRLVLLAEEVAGVEDETDE